jgi:DNA-binding transcriptional LysR family regulator
VVALPRTHKLAQGRREEAVPLKALAAETFIIYGRKDGFGLYAATIVACHEAGFKPRFGQEARRLASALSLVAAELGVFLSPPRSSACRWTGSSIAGSKVHVSLDQL